MDQVDARQRMRPRPGKQVGRVAREQANVGDITGLYLCQDLRHAVDVRLASDEAGVRKRKRLCDEMLAAAESNLKPDVVQRRVKDCCKRRWRGRRNIESQDRKSTRLNSSHLGIS